VPRLALFLLAIWLCAVVAGCGDGNREFANPRGTIEVGEGERFTLAFTINPGVGYDWELVGRRPTGVVRYGGRTAEPGEPETAGGSATSRFAFEAAARGTRRVIFLHRYRGRVVERRIISVRVT